MTHNYYDTTSECAINNLKKKLKMANKRFEMFKQVNVELTIFDNKGTVFNTH